MLEKLRALREQHLRVVHNVEFYEYQEEISDRILSALVQNLRITKGMLEAEIKKLELIEQPIEISRQAGKTTAIVYTVEFILIYLTRLFNRRIAIGVFAPQIEQAKTDFDRLKEALMRSDPLFKIDEESADQKHYKEQNNAKTLVLSNGSSAYIFPVTATSKPESKSLDLLIFEESQDLDDTIIKQQVFPMGASTNAPRVFIGTAGTRICHFLKIGRSKNAVKLYFEEIARQRRALYEKTGDVRHLLYEQYIRSEIEKAGIDSDEIQRPYFGKWLIGTGQFVTEAELDKLVTERKITFRFSKTGCFAGIDTAKHPDSTIVTILRYNAEIKKKEVLNWLELHGDNYQDQFDHIKFFLSNYRIDAIAIDSTGQGDFMPDMFEKHTQWKDENSGLYRIKFSAVSKDNMYKNLKVSIREFLTTLPILSTKQGEKFKQQMLDLQQEYKGQLLSVKHPDDAKAHDDYPDSWALAEWAYAEYTKNDKASIASITATEERTEDIKRDSEGNITDHWPGH
ncbi:hypothetical protein UFOVP585_31 [uncultured Caudovirales phage]|uniref:Terminase RNaseH-like domain containing protein n=1 Tax=uncultured Caudovirales phage TaxID=2100421 RepID=A0A6J5MWM8_9CAUD|nr:hypothetical protein UFOVP585_31 [uncultured Caudovirales phage]